MILKNANDDTCFSIEPKDGWVEITQAELDAIRESRRVSNAPTFQQLTPRQIREALIDLNLIEEIEAAVALGDRKLRNWWEHATAFERNHPLVVGMGQALGKTPAELDAVFQLGAAL